MGVLFIKLLPTLNMLDCSSRAVVMVQSNQLHQLVPMSGPLALIRVAMYSIALTYKMAVSPTVILTLLYYSLLTAHTLAKYGDPYPLSASWFKDRTSVPDVEQTLSTFQSLGGDTVLLRGAEFVNSTAANVKRDPQFLQCTEGRDNIEPRSSTNK